MSKKHAEMVTVRAVAITALLFCHSNFFHLSFFFFHLCVVFFTEYSIPMPIFLSYTNITGHRVVYNLVPWNAQANTMCNIGLQRRISSASISDTLRMGGYIIEKLV